jgi:GT2 family glycosyltransferase
VDFDGYFNLFYIKKRKVYTQISKLYLEVCAPGYETLHLLHDGEEIDRISLASAADATRQTVCVELPYERYEDGCFWFAVSGAKTEASDAGGGTSSIGASGAEDGTCGSGTDAEAVCTEPISVSGMFFGEIPDDKVNPVNLGIDICTFRREPYVERNLRQMCTRIMEQKELQVSDHVQIFIIDNGQTLADCEPVQTLVRSHESQVHVIANRNAGGSGGFTRGMMELLSRKDSDGFTHVLLMDDDAVVEPDTLVRIYGFLSTVREEWKDITVGGALLREEQPHILFCAGEWWENGYTVPNPDTNLDLRTRDHATCPYLTETGHEHDRYSGWWCCCYSLNTVRENNLPLPLFIHHDDIEYGIRNREAGIVFLNGVNIWHRDVELSMPGTNMYYDVRNTLIEMALQKVGRGAAVKWLLKHYAGELLRHRYTSVAFINRGIQDYLKGPGWLHAQQPEKLHAELMRQAPKARPIEDASLKRYDIRTPYAQILREKKYYLQAPGSEKAQLYERSEVKTLTAILQIMKYIAQIAWNYPRMGDVYRQNRAKITTFEAWDEYLKNGREEK